MRFEILHELLVERVEDRLAYIAKTFPSVTPEQAQMLVAADPSPTGQYLVWLAKLLHAKKIRMPEDARDLRSSLEEFDRAKITKKFKGTDADIMRYKSRGELRDKLDVLSGVKTKGDMRRAEASAGLKHIGQKGAWDVWLVTTPEAAAKIGKGTQWCTRFTDTAKNYLGIAPLLVITHEDKPAYQLHMPEDTTSDECQGKDEKDNPLYRDDVVLIRPLLDFILPYAHVLTGELAGLLNLKDNTPANVERILAHADHEQLVDFADMLPLKSRSLQAKISRKILTTPRLVIQHAQSTHQRLPALGEKTLLKHPVLLAQYVIGRPYIFKISEPHGLEEVWPEAYRTIVNDGNAASYFARKSSSTRFLEGEPAILRNASPSNLYLYAKFVVKEKWPELEKVLLEKARKGEEDAVQFLSMYAITVTQERLPEAEPFIVMDPVRVTLYAGAFFEKNGWPLAEKTGPVSEDPNTAVTYVISILGPGHRYKPVEHTVLKNPEAIIRYVEFCVKGRWPEGEEVLVATGDNKRWQYYLNSIRKSEKDRKAAIAQHGRAI